MIETSASTIAADIVIVGSGMVGGALAWSLAGIGLQVVVVERGTLGQTASAAGERSTALSWGSQQLLQTIGLWAELAANAAPIKRIHVSQQGHLGSMRMRAEDHNIDALGYVVRNAELLRCLEQALPKASNLTVLSQTQLHAVSQHNDELRLSLAGGQKIKAKLLVVADGGDSSTRELAGIDTTEVDYEQHAIVATLTHKEAPQQMAWERFTANGPLALLPLGGDRLSLVYTLPNEHVDQVMSLSDDAFIQRVQADIGRRPGRIVSASRRQVFPLRRVSVGESWQGRVVLLGNAARSLHPVAGQGFNLALRDAMTLAEQLQGLAVGQDAGSAFMRKQFLSRRSADQRQTTGLTDGLARGFRGHSGLLGHIRSAGLIATDRLPLLRQGFARRSMGLAHRIPKVAAPPL